MSLHLTSKGQRQDSHKADEQMLRPLLYTSYCILEGEIIDTFSFSTDPQQVMKVKGSQLNCACLILIKINATITTQITT